MTTENRYTEILQHRIAFSFRGEGAPTELGEVQVEHIEDLIKKGFNQGELCHYDVESDVEYRGWWSIEK